MNEQDVDKIFRDNLAHSEESISDADWKQFEAMAGSSPSYKWVYLISGMLLLGTASFFAFHGLKTSEQTTGVHINDQDVSNSGNKNVIEKEAQQNSNANSTAFYPMEENVSQIDNSNKDIRNFEAKNSEVVTTANNSYNISNNGDSILESEPKLNKVVGDGQISNKTIPTQSIAKKSEVRNHIKPREDKTITSTTPSLKSDLAPIGRTVLESNTKSNSQYQSGNVSQEGQENSTLTSGSNISASAQTLIFAPKEMSTINNAEVPSSHDKAELNTDAPRLELPKARNLTLGIFGAYELNNELGGIPEVGLMANWNSNKWKLGAGVGIARSNNLAWVQESQQVEYGFDRYQTNVSLTTNSFTYLSIPIQLSRMLDGQNGVFIGAKASFIVDASQTHITSQEGGSTKTGYNYDIGTPSMLFFVSGGYQYYIKEDLRMEIGINYSPQNWKVTTKNPLGGIIRLNYTIR